MKLMMNQTILKVCQGGVVKRNGNIFDIRFVLVSQN